MLDPGPGRRLEHAVITESEDAAQNGGAGQFVLPGRFDNAQIRGSVWSAIGASHIGSKQYMLLRGIHEITWPDPRGSGFFFASAGIVPHSGQRSGVARRS